MNIKNISNTIGVHNVLHTEKDEPMSLINKSLIIINNIADSKEKVE